MKIFLEISGVILWVILITLIIFGIVESYKEKKKHKEYLKRRIEYRYEEHWCNECQDITEHEVRGEGFNEYRECLDCETK